MKQALVAVVCLTLFCSSAVCAAVGGGDVTIKYKKGQVVFSHDSHVGMGLECTACHAGIFTSSAQHKTVTMKQMQKGTSCGACHNGKTAFTVKSNCNNCHKK